MHASMNAPMNASCSWAVTYKGGKSQGRHGCYGRMWHDGAQSTVVTRPEPHNLQLLHPEQVRGVCSCGCRY